MKLLLSLAVVGQVLAQPSFEVTSVKPSANGGPMSLSPLTGGKVTARNVNIRTLIRASYQVQDFQISGAPNWLESERYDIDAKSAASAGADETRLMVQALLTDRFQLKIRRETKETPAYALIVANGKTRKMTPADKTGCEPEPSPTNPCQRIRNSGNMAISGEKLSMPLFAKMLSSMLRDTVIDKTGLDGVYDFKLDLGLAGFTPTPSSPSNEMDGINAVMSGLQDQLGLKLERTKSAVEVLVIEHVEKPTAN
jgi:uncharacterized protein (TIGR03435 family)